MQRVKGELDKAAEEVEKKNNEHLDEIGIQSWLTRIEAMKKYDEGKHVDWDLAVETLAYEDAKKY